MKSSSSFRVGFATLAVFLLAIGLGWLMGRPSHSHENVSQVESSDRRESGSSLRRRTRDQNNSRLSRIRNARDSREAALATIALVNSIKVDEIQNWIDEGWFDFRAGPEHTLFRKLLEERWRLEDPDGFTIWRLQNGDNMDESGSGNAITAALPILNEWAIKDPERFRKTLRDFPNKDLEAQVIASIGKENPLLALQYLEGLFEEGRADRGYLLREALQQIAKGMTPDMEAVLEKLPSALSVELEKHLMVKRFDQEFSSTLQELSGRSDGLKIFKEALRSNKKLAEKFIDELPNLPAHWKASIASTSNPNFFWNKEEMWLKVDLDAAGFSPEQKRELKRTLIQTLSYRDPVLALSHLNQSELSTEQRSRIIRSSLRQLRESPGKLEESLAYLTSDDERKMVQDFIDRAAEKESSPRVTQKQGLDDWLEEAVSGEERSREDQTRLAGKLRSMSVAELKKLSGRFKSMNEEEKDQLLSVMNPHSRNRLNRSAPEFAGQALLHEVKKAGETVDDSVRQAAGHASSLAATWAGKDPEAASKWVDSLPAGMARTSAQEGLVKSWNRYDPDAVKKWMESLPEAEVERLRDVLKN